MDRRFFNSDPDPAFHFGDDPVPDPYQDLDPNPSLTHDVKSELFFLTFIHSSGASIGTLFYLSPQRHR